MGETELRSQSKEMDLALSAHKAWFYSFGAPPMSCICHVQIQKPSNHHSIYMEDKSQHEHVFWYECGESVCVLLVCGVWVWVCCDVGCGCVGVYVYVCIDSDVCVITRTWWGNPLKEHGIPFTQGWLCTRLAERIQK